jgi:hypothetical protein
MRRHRSDVGYAAGKPWTCERERRPLYLERYPLSVLEWVRWAVEEEELSHAQAAGLLNVEVVTFRHQIGLLKDPPEATVEEQEFDQLPPWVAQGVDAE